SVTLQFANTLCDPACLTPPGQTTPQPFQFFDDQFSSLWAWRTSGNSSYHALQLSLRHPFSAGLQFDFNYTFSKSIDVGSNAERINLFDVIGNDVIGNNVGGFSSQVINSFEPDQLRAPSDFDTPTRSMQIGSMSCYSAEAVTSARIIVLSMHSWAIGASRDWH